MARANASAGRVHRGAATIVALAALTAGAFAALALQPAVSPAAASCAHAGAVPHHASLTKLRTAITCLVNHERSKRDLHSLKPDRKLRRAAQRHNHRMLAKDCFKHRCPPEHGLPRRVKKSGYEDGATSWRFAEDLGFDNTPRQMVKRLLHSAPNRRRMLNPDFRDVGVAVGWGTPVRRLDDSKFATYTLVFGWRKP